MTSSKFEEIEENIAGLCQLLKSKVTNSEEAMEYVNVGEYGLALEFLSDWCLDQEPEIIVSAKELILFLEISKKWTLVALG